MQKRKEKRELGKEDLRKLIILKSKEKKENK